MSLKLRFVQLDVFTTTRFLGNPLAIVFVPDRVEITQVQKQRIAAEFNLSETVFLHETEPNDNGPVVIDIFTTTEELPFAGHPTIGSGWYLLSSEAMRQVNGGDGIITLRTKAGDIPIIQYQDGNGTILVQAQVPIDFKVHSPFTQLSLKALQTNLEDADYANGKNGAEAIVSVVRGMTFILLQLTSEDALARMQRYPSRFLSVANLGEWDGFVGVYAFYEREDGIVRTRMFDGSLEDPATGSAASTLGGWLAKRKGEGKWRINIVQGVEMGRRSEIMVEVDIGSDGEVAKISLGGGAIGVMEGWVTADV